MLKNKFLSFFLFFIITYSASFIGGFVTVSFKEPWYSQLVKSNYNPPDWVFAPIWTTLYLMMTLAIWFFWHSKNRDMNTVYIYFIHIVFNTTWSIVFFGLHQILLALIVLLVLIFLIIILILRFKRVNLLSYYLMIPYLLWTTYALFLNLNLLILN
ncbi:MAG: tryptophan-rich sensory protein [Candidatus Pelagibacter sp. TMED239]|nr:MAG: tryptophan-rich sensory protein [Candidatus Pelagibacter sp. TMED239]